MRRKAKSIAAGLAATVILLALVEGASGLARKGEGHYSAYGNDIVASELVTRLLALPGVQARFDASERAVSSTG